MVEHSLPKVQHSSIVTSATCQEIPPTTCPTGSSNDAQDLAATLPASANVPSSSVPIHSQNPKMGSSQASSNTVKAVPPRPLTHVLENGQLDMQALFQRVRSLNPSQKQALFSGFLNKTKDEVPPKSLKSISSGQPSAYTNAPNQSFVAKTINSGSSMNHQLASLNQSSQGQYVSSQPTSVPHLKIGEGSASQSQGVVVPMMQPSTIGFTDPPVHQLCVAAEHIPTSLSPTNKTSTKRKKNSSPPQPSSLPPCKPRQTISGKSAATVKIIEELAEKHLAAETEAERTRITHLIPLKLKGPNNRQLPPKGHVFGATSHFNQQPVQVRTVSPSSTGTSIHLSPPRGKVFKPSTPLYQNPQHPDISTSRNSKSGKRLSNISRTVPNFSLTPSSQPVTSSSHQHTKQELERPSKRTRIGNKSSFLQEIMSQDTSRYATPISGGQSSGSGSFSPAISIRTPDWSSDQSGDGSSTEGRHDDQANNAGLNTGPKLASIENKSRSFLGGGRARPGMFTGGFYEPTWLLEGTLEKPLEGSLEGGACDDTPACYRKHTKEAHEAENGCGRPAPRNSAAKGKQPERLDNGSQRAAPPKPWDIVCMEGRKCEHFWIHHDAAKEVELTVDPPAGQWSSLSQPPTCPWMMLALWGHPAPTPIVEPHLEVPTFFEQAEENGEWRVKDETLKYLDNHFARNGFRTPEGAGDAGAKLEDRRFRTPEKVAPASKEYLELLADAEVL